MNPFDRDPFDRNRVGPIGHGIDVTARGAVPLPDPHAFRSAVSAA